MLSRCPCRTHSVSDRGLLPRFLINRRSLLEQTKSVFQPVIQQRTETDKGDTSGNVAERLQIGILVSNDFAIVVIVVEIIVEIVVHRFGCGGIVRLLLQ